MEVVICSVPYTGTNFTAKLFTDKGFQRIGMIENSPAGDCVRVAHAIKDTQVNPAIKRSESGRLVLPVRHPFRCEESNRRKGLDIGDMLLGYENLITRLAPLTDLFMAVDSPWREDQFRHIKDSLDLPLKTTWEVINSKSQTFDLDGFSPSPEVEDLFNRYRDFFSKFYP